MLLASLLIRCRLCWNVRMLLFVECEPTVSRSDEEDRHDADETRDGWDPPEIGRISSRSQHDCLHSKEYQVEGGDALDGNGSCDRLVNRVAELGHELE